MRLLLISYNIVERDGRLRELIKVCENIGETIYITQANKDKKHLNKRHIEFKTKGFFKYIKFILFVVRQSKKIDNIDIIFADNRTSILPALFIKHIFKPAYLIHDARELYLIHETKSLKGKLGSLIEKIFLKRFDVILCPNIYRAEIMKKEHKLKEQPVVFENIRKLENRSSDDSKFKENLNCYLNNDKIKIVSTAGCLVSRRSDALARTVCELGEQYSLFLIGYSSPKDREVIYRIKNESMVDNIIIFEWLSESELKYVLQNCDIGVVSYGEHDTNNKYCASGKIFEYLFEGLPVLTTQNPPLKHMCSKYKIGVSDNNFKRGIKQLVKQLNLYRENVQYFVKDLNIENYNKKIAKEIMLRIEGKKINISRG